MAGCAQQPSAPVALTPEQTEAAKLAAEGTKVMMDGEKLPMQKYPEALALYDKALKLDPENKEAKSNRAMILDIYESMGKKPPQPKETGGSPSGV